MRVGIVGGGQLGRMLALAGMPLGMTFRFLEKHPEAVAGIGECFTEWSAFAQGVDVITYEFENVELGPGRVFPPVKALEIARDRLLEKELFRSLNIPTVAYAPVASEQELRAAVERIGFPCILKTRRMGYDGKGQRVLSGPEDVGSVTEPSILEQKVELSRELAVCAVRGRDGKSLVYPVTQTAHCEGILRVAHAPVQVPEAQLYALTLLEALDYVGVLALELFQVGDALMANEMAPRVHNSGHWTQDAAATSQFENHLRAVCGLPLGPTDLREPVAMLNLIGELPDLGRLLEIPGLKVHLYGKTPRPGRKLGHLNLLSPDGERVARVEELLQEERRVGSAP